MEFFLKFRLAAICFNLEAGHVHYQNYNWGQGHECFQKSVQISNLTFELTGVYGKKTKFQQKDVAQLLLKINKNDETVDLNGEFKNVKWDYLNKEMDLKFLPKVFINLVSKITTIYD